MSEPYYQDEWVTLYHGDCLEITDWLEADVLVTDPPYGIAAHSNSAKEYGRRERLGEMNLLIAGDRSTDARDRALALWGPRPSLIFGSWRAARPRGVRALLIWDKAMPGQGSMSLPWGSGGHEEIYVCGPNATPSMSGWALSGSRDNPVIRAQYPVPGSRERPHGESNHPTPKPVALMTYLLSKCPPGIIADPFAGSGSTLVAAKALGRHAIGVELEERYCEISARRLAQDVLDFGGNAS